MENIWSSLHPFQEGESDANLADYSLIATDMDIIAALKEGLKETQTMLRVLNMAPSNQASAANRLWFVSPWKLEKHDPSHLAYQPPRTLQLGLDGDVECEQARLESCPDFELETGVHSNPNEVFEYDIDGDDLATLTALEEEIRQMFVELLSERELQVSNRPLSLKVLPIVTFQGHFIYKFTLVSQLNGNPYLSKERLIRMKNSIYFNNSDDYLAASSSTTSMLLGLGFDVGVYFKDMRGSASTVRAARTKTSGRPAAINSRLTNSMCLYRKGAENEDKGGQQVGHLQAANRLDEEGNSKRK